MDEGTVIGWCGESQECAKTHHQERNSFVLGPTGFYREYIPNYPAVAAPLTDLLKKRQPNKLIWGEAQNEHTWL